MLLGDSIHGKSSGLLLQHRRVEELGYVRQGSNGLLHGRQTNSDVLKEIKIAPGDEVKKM